MPLKVLQSNERIAEVQFICDICGKLMRTSLIPIKDVKTEDSKKIVCCQCKLRHLW